MAEAVVTFEEARIRLLKQLKTQCFRLYEVVAEKEWCNPEYRAYKKALDDIYATTKLIGRLNEVQGDCEDLDGGTVPVDAPG